MATAKNKSWSASLDCMATALAWGLSQIATFLFGAERFDHDQAEQDAAKFIRQELGRATTERARKATAIDPTPRKPQFIGGPLDGLDGLSLDSPSQEFYFPSTPKRFAYYVCDGTDWSFVGWRSKQQVLAGG